MAFLDYPGLQRFTNKFKAWVNAIVGNSDMGTTATTLTGAIAEHTGQITALEAVDPVLAVNGTEPDPSGNVNISTVDYAYNLVSDDAQSSYGEFIERTTGGDASLSDGDAWLSSIRGRSVHTGYTPESLSFNVDKAERPEGVDTDIEATLNRNTFVQYVSQSGTIAILYTSSNWTVGGSTVTPSNYGLTITGTPYEGDTITIYYTKEVRGTITNATPTSFNSTGWNLFQYTTAYEGYSGYAKVLNYSEQYGFLVGGTYTSLEFSETFDGAKTSLTVVSDAFVVPSDGYVWVVGGDNTSTYIHMTWSDWISGPSGGWAEYDVSTIDLSSIMANFTFGLCRVGTVADVIDFDLHTAISNIGRMEYSDANLATVKTNYSAWDYDENYIYYVKNTADSYQFSVDGAYTASDHGIEYFTGTSVPLYATMLYGQNLRDKLRSDVLTKSAQVLSEAQQNQVIENLGFGNAVKCTVANNATTTTSGYVADARQIKALNDNINNVTDGSYKNTSYNSTVSWYKCGHIVCVKIAGTTNAERPNSTAIATLPAGYRPPASLVQTLSRSNETVGRVEISSNGNVTVKPKLPSSTYLGATFCYIVS